MNKDFKKINEEDILFFDIEVVRRSKELEIDSREFNLFRKKTRNRDTDEFLDNVEVVELYERKAALYLGYGTIVTIGVGFIQKGKVYIKDLTGDEETIIKEFCTIAKKFKHVCGFNILRYDLPKIVANGYRYFDVCETLPDRFITANKKPWELGSVVDLMDVYKGTHFVSPSFDEVLYNFGLESPKDVIDGSEVSRVYWNEGGIDKISTYVKKDVFSNINLFKAMRFESIFDEFIDRADKEESFTSFEDFKKNRRLSKELLQDLKEKAPKEKDKKLIREILLAGTLPIKGRVAEQEEQSIVVDAFLEDLYK